MNYEDLVVAIAHIDAATDIIGVRCPDFIDRDDYEFLNAFRNNLNKERLRLLGNGTGRPYTVSELIEQHSAEE